MNPFKKAERSQVYLKLAITGPTGSGKTFSALRLANGLLKDTGKRIAFLDTENDSASLYAPGDGEQADNVKTFDFDVLSITPPFEHEKFMSGVKVATENDYGLVIIDSSSHFWEGILEYKSKLDSRPGSNSYTNWNEAGKKFQGIIDAVLQSKIHVICCMRSKMDYVLEDNGKGKTVPKRVGLAPIMRDGVDYEFTTVFDVALNHECAVSKDRSSLFTDKIFQITEDTGCQIAAWLKSAKPKSEEPATAPELTPEAELTKRIGARKTAALKERPESINEASWLKQYAKTAATVCDFIGERESLESMSIPELKEVATKHAAIVAKMKEQL